MDSSWNRVKEKQELVVVSLLVMGDRCRLSLTALRNITQFSSRDSRYNGTTLVLRWRLGKENDLYIVES